MTTLTNCYLTIEVSGVKQKSSKDLHRQTLTRVNQNNATKLFYKDANNWLSRQKSDVMRCAGGGVGIGWVVEVWG